MTGTNGDGAVGTVEAPVHVVDRSGPPLLEADGVWKIFGPHADRIIGTPDAALPRAELREKTGCTIAVRDISLQVWPGEVFVVMGLSGSGKSTLVRTLIRLIEPTAGAIHITGSDVMAADAAELRDLRRHTVSMVFQHFGLLAHRTVIENVAFGQEIQGSRARTTCCASSASRTSRRASPTSCRAACSSASGWRARSRSTRS
jgi:ABC-type proline/glycine betaine transport system ATPase subunit